MEFVHERLTAQLEGLTEVAKTLVSAADLPGLLSAVMHTIVRVVEQADMGAIMLWDPSSALFRAEAAFGYDFQALREIGLRAGESITGKVFDQGRACLLASPAEVAVAMADMRAHNREAVTRSIGTDMLPYSAVAAPITAGKDRFGVLVLEALDHHKQFTHESLSFVQTLADLVALAIERDRLEVRADAVREARRGDRLRSEIMATLSHELRMPLATIKGYSTALLLDELRWGEDKRKEFLQLISESCDEMEGMIQDILDSSLIEVDQLNLEWQPMDLPSIAGEVALEVQHRSEIHRPVVDFAKRFPFLRGDPRWIKQVFRNIVDNAVKYSPDGGLIVIRGEVRPADVVVSVADQGIGISSEDQIPLFEKYFRARSASTLHISGTGLGLPIARAIVEAHGGRIWVESRAGEGTTIFFSLPRQQPSGDER